MTHPHDGASTDPADRNRLGRAIAARHLGGVASRGGLGSVAAASLRFARGWGRPAVVRRHLSRPLPVAAGPTTQLRVAAPALELRPPRWWVPAPTEEPAPLPGRGLRRVVRRMPSDTTSPGAGSARLAPQTVPMRMPAEVDAVGRMTTAADSRPRSSNPPSRPSGSRSAGGPPGNVRGAGTRPPHGAGTDRAATVTGPAKPPAPTTAAAPRTPTSGPVVSRLLRRRALARLTREEHTRPVLAGSRAPEVRRTVTPPAPAVPAASNAAGPTTSGPTTVPAASSARDLTPAPGAVEPRPGDTELGAGGSRPGDSSTAASRTVADGAAPGTPGPAVLDGTTAGAPLAPVRRARPGRTLRPLAGPVRRTTTSRSAHAPLVGSAGADGRLGRRGNHGEVAVGGAPGHVPAPPSPVVPEVRRSTADAASTAAGAAVPPSPTAPGAAGPVVRSPGAGTSTPAPAASAGAARTIPSLDPGTDTGHRSDERDAGPRHRLPGTGHRRPAGVRRSTARALGTDTPGLRRLTSAVPHTVAPARDTGAHPAPVSVRPAATHGAAAARVENHAARAGTVHAATTSGAPVRRSVGKQAASGTHPAGVAALAGTGALGDDARHVDRPAATASPAARIAPADHSGPLAPARPGAVRRSTAVGPLPAAPTSPAGATSALTESARPNAVGAALRGLAPVAVVAASPPARPGQNALPSGPVVRRWDLGRARGAAATAPRRPLLAQARGAVQGAGAQPAAPATAGTPADAAAAPTTAAPPRPSTPAPLRPPAAAVTTGLPPVRALSVAPPLAAVGPQDPSTPATPAAAGAPPPRRARAGAHRRPAAAAPGTPAPPTVFAPPPWAQSADPPPAAPGQHRTEGADVRPNLWSADPESAQDTDVLASEVQQRVIARLEDWIVTDLDERVLDIVERRMSEETERRAWRMGSEVF